MDTIGNMRYVEEYLRKHAGLGRSFDAVFRPLKVGTRNAALFFFNGFAKDLILTPILDRMSYVNREELFPLVMQNLFRTFIPGIQVQLETDLDTVIEKVMAGNSAIFIERERQVIVLDTRMFPVRSPEEPSNEKVVRGSRDGFVETLLTNVTLVRRRLRDPAFICEIHSLGRHTKTDVCLAYLDGKAQPSVIDEIRSKFQRDSDTDLPMTDKQLEELLVDDRLSLFPKVRYSERPDVICTHLLEGHVVIFVDTSPSVMILPATFFHHLQHAEEYRNTTIVGTYLRWVRYFGVFASLLLLPVWLLFALHPYLLPEQLSFIGPRDHGSLPLLVQFLLAEIGIDVMRMAAIHTPTPLATAMGLIAAILIGEIAVKVGLFVPEVILYVAVAAIGSFATPSYELSLANRLLRIVMLFSVAVFSVPGLMIAITIMFVFAVRRRSFGTPFLEPFIPFRPRHFLQLLIRSPYKRRSKL